MKKILTLSLFALVFCSLSYAQGTYNFTTKDGEVIWQKVYTTNLETRAVFDTIKTSGSLSDISL